MVVKSCFAIIYKAMYSSRVMRTETQIMLLLSMLKIPPSIGFTIYSGQAYSLNFFRPPPSFKIKTSFGGSVSHTKAIINAIL